jgi:Tol biopolymer transport system component
LKILAVVAGVSVLACSGVSEPGGITEPSDGSPSGQIAFVGPDDRLWLMNADGSNQKALTPGHAADPAWSPDGQRLAFTGDSGIYVMDAAGAGIVRVTSGGVEPSWSPDGARIAFSLLRWDSTGAQPVLSQRLAVVNPDGSAFAWLSSGAYDGSPAWSPDGTRIAFVRNLNDGETPTALYIMLVAHPSTLVPATFLPSGGRCSQSAPAWTPDGKSLLFWSACPEAPATFSGPFGFALGNADGSGTMTPVMSNVSETYLSDPSLSPDGKWIVFSSPGADVGGANSMIYVMHAQGSNATALAPGTHPAWRPVR